MKSKSAFTLVEILVVVLIIGILTAVAIPMYQSAVDKTHWSTLLPTARALKNAEEAYLMATNAYTDNADALDVAATQGDATYELQMPGSDSLYAIRATTPKLPTVRLAQYLDDNAIRAGQLYCEASDGEDGRGTKLCEKLLNGQELGTTDDGYTQYLLDQEVDKVTCEGVNRSWSTSKTKCYKDTASRCSDLGLPVIAGRDMCGKKNAGSGTFGPENVCLATYTFGCQKIDINGGACISTAGRDCLFINVTNGGTCVANKNNSYENMGACSGSFTNNSICYANVEKSCTSYGRTIVTTYDETSCCRGAYCGSAPSCESRGKTCDPYYMNKSNFLD